MPANTSVRLRITGSCVPYAVFAHMAKQVGPTAVGQRAGDYSAASRQPADRCTCCSRSRTPPASPPRPARTRRCAPAGRVPVIDAGRRHRLVTQRPRGDQQTAPRAGDHLVARRQMFERVIDDLAHAFGDRLVLHRDMRDAGVDHVVALRLPIDQIVVRRVLHRPPAAEPVGACSADSPAPASSPGSARRPSAPPCATPASR